MLVRRRTHHAIPVRCPGSAFSDPYPFCTGGWRFQIRCRKSPSPGPRPAIVLTSITFEPAAADAWVDVPWLLGGKDSKQRRSREGTCLLSSYVGSPEKQAIFTFLNSL